MTYDHTFNDKHTVNALFSTTADHYTEGGIEINGKDFSDESDYLQYLAYANTDSAVDNMKGPDANVSLIARLAYFYDDRYFVIASWRRDYAGRLPKENNYGDFPAVTAGWKISNESFFPQSETLNLLKARASWGRVDNLGSIEYNYKSALLAKNYWTKQTQYGVEGNKLWGNYVYNSTALNPNLTWETSEQWDLGLDMNMFQNRLSNRTLSIYISRENLFTITNYSGMDPECKGWDERFHQEGCYGRELFWEQGAACDIVWGRTRFFNTLATWAYTGDE